MNNIVINKISILFFIVLCAATVYFLLSKLFIIMIPFILGYIVASILNPLVTLMHENARIPRSFVSIMSVFGFFALGGFLSLRFILFVANKLMLFSGMIPELVNELISYNQVVELELNKLVSTFDIDMTFDLANFIKDTLAQLISKIGEFTAGLAGSLLSFVTSIPSIIVFFMIMVISAFLIVKDYQLIHYTVKHYYRLYSPFKKEIKFFKKNVIKVLIGYYKAQFMLMCITFTLSFIGLSALKVNYAVYIALGIAIVDALPIFGPATVYMPWIISQLIVGNVTLGVLLLILYLCVTFTRQLLEPKLVGKQIGVYPLITLMSMYIGLKLMGIIGILVGPLTVITFKTFYEYKEKPEH